MLAFLHTSPVHVATFDALLAPLAPGLRARHLVDEALLARARASGAQDGVLGDQVQEAVRSLVQQGAKVVVCTCSTVGGLAEATPVPPDVSVMRIDRAMAEQAVAGGTRILVVAALASTLRPTRDLLVETAARAGRAIQITELLCERAWKLFETGDVAGYVRQVADAIAVSTDTPDVVVLAQASLAPVAALLPDARAPILSSPRLGLLAALDRMRGRSG